MTFNSPLIGLVIRIIALIVVSIPTIIQVHQMNHIKDGYTVIRWLLLILLTIFSVSSVPGITYLFVRTEGFESPVLRDVSTITTNLTILSSALLFAVLYLYIFFRDWAEQLLRKWRKK